MAKEILGIGATTNTYAAENTNQAKKERKDLTAQNKLEKAKGRKATAAEIGEIRRNS